MCVGATGSMCGCPKQCVAPSEAHHRENKMNLAHATLAFDGVASI